MLGVGPRDLIHAKQDSTNWAKFPALPPGAFETGSLCVAAQADLELGELPASGSSVLGLKTYATITCLLADFYVAQAGLEHLITLHPASEDQDYRCVT